MLKAGFIKHTVNKANFSEQCYYIFGDITSNMAVCSLKVFMICERFEHLKNNFFAAGF